MVAVTVCAVLLVASLASPALGGPSIGSVAQTAKKALKTAKSAKRTANGARSKADQALSRPVVTPAGITPVRSATAFIVSGEVGSAAAFCPAGQRVVSGGGAMVSGVGDGLAVSEPNAARTAWFVVAVNNSVITAELDATALCVPAGGVVAADAGATRREIAQVVERLEQKLEAAD